MSKLIPLITLTILLALTLVAALRATAAAPSTPAAPTKERFFEMRTYTAAEGKFDALHARFRDHTIALFLKHGITIIGFWTPTEGDTAKNTLVYLLAYPSKEAREKSWAEFQADPDWIKAKADSEKNGKLTDKVVSTYMKPTDYSPMK